MSSLRLETVVNHDGRLNLLCCLLDAGLLSGPQLAARIGESKQTVRYWTRPLDPYGLIEQRDKPHAHRRALHPALPLHADAEPDRLHHASRGPSAKRLSV